MSSKYWGLSKALLSEDRHGCWLRLDDPSVSVAGHKLLFMTRICSGDVVKKRESQYTHQNIVSLPIGTLPKSNPKFGKPPCGDCGGLAVTSEGLEASQPRTGASEGCMRALIDAP